MSGKAIMNFELKGVPPTACAAGNKKTLEDVMKKSLLIIISIVCILGWMDMAEANTYVINDMSTSTTAYWGGAVQNSQGYRDVIGDEFAVDSMTVQTGLPGNQWKVTLTGAYFANYRGSTGYAPQFGPGDLYISPTGWKTTTTDSPHYPTDTFTKGEGWTYVVSFTNKAVYLIDWNANLSPIASANNSTNTIQSTNIDIVPPLPPATYEWRDSQAWVGGYGTSKGSAVVELGTNWLSFTFPVGDLSLTNEVGLHWTMRCGNDVNEGAVPIPPSILMLGSGLVGFVVIRRRIKK
jgi:hypothetical protein